MPAMSQLETAQRAHREEVRFAVVLNGGVSLAVWMGGVVHEIDAVTQGYADDERTPDHAYGRLMTVLGVRARADVIAGTSAGGINGAALALAQVNQSADLSTLRDLWAQQGRMETLLQRPFTGQPSSLLRGEEYFLPKLGEAMSRLSREWMPRDNRPVHLTITATLLDGALATTTDSMGQVLPQLRHDGRFRFRRGFKEVAPEVVDGKQRYTETEHDDFDGSEEMAARLGLSARCSAGFPVAFEPSFVPVGRPGADRPDMARWANWAKFDRAADPGSETPDLSRFAVDGGVLSNTPTREALDAIQQLGAKDPVQRVMLIVFPHAPATLADPPSKADAPPSLPGSLGSMLAALRADGGRTHVDRIEEHNRRAACRRDTREDLLQEAELSSLAGQLYRSYSKLRIQRAARDLPDRIDLPASWSFERTRQACLKAQQEYVESGRPLPYVPEQLAAAWHTVDNPDPDADPRQLRAWGWGATTALDLADIALSAIEALRKQGRTAQLDEAAGRIHEHMSRIRIARAELDESWRTMSFVAPAGAPGAAGVSVTASFSAQDSAVRSLLIGPDVAYWIRRLAVYDYFMNGRPIPEEALPTALVGRLGQGGEATSAAVSGILSELLRAWATRPAPQEPTGWAWLFEDHAGGATDQADVDRLHAEHSLLQKLLQLHVVSWTLGDEVESDNTRPVELVQLSAQVRHDFATYSTDMASKLGSDELGRFSGFLKTSWRMNDWAWGRLDAAVMLFQILLRPSRIRRYAAGLESQPVTADRVVDSLFEVVAGVALRSELGLDLLRRRAVSEVVALLDIPDDDSVRSPALAHLLAYGRQVETIVVDLPAIASGVQADVADGGGERSAGVGFLQEARDVLDDIAQLPKSSGMSDEELASARAVRFDAGFRSLDALDRSGIGREGIRDVANTDQVIRTAMTTAAVLGTVADSPASGLAKLKPVTKFVRGALLLPYWVTLGLTSASAIARLLAVLALAGGAVTLALAVLGVLPDALAAAAAMVGAGTVLFVFGYAAARTGSVLHAFAFMTVGLPLLVVGVDRITNKADDSSSTALAVLLIVVGVSLLGSVPNPILSPAALVAGVTRAGLRTAAVVAMVVLAVAAGVVAVVVLAGDWIAERATDLWDWLVDLPGWVTVAAVVTGAVVLVVALFVAWRLTYRLSRGFALVSWTATKTWTRQPIRHPVALFAAWSPVYGAAYAVVAGGLWAAGWVPTGWGVAGLAIGAAFTFVVPFLSLSAARRVILRRVNGGVSFDERHSARRPAQLGGYGSFSQWLTMRDLPYAFLVAEGGEDPKSPQLTDEGRSLLASLQVAFPEPMRSRPLSPPQRTAGGSPAGSAEPALTAGPADEPPASP